jgi:hypothetical protein
MLLPWLLQMLLRLLLVHLIYCVLVGHKMYSHFNPLERLKMHTEEPSSSSSNALHDGPAAEENVLVVVAPAVSLHHHNQVSLIFLFSLSAAVQHFFVVIATPIFI